MMKDRQVSFAGMSLNKHFKVASIERPLPEFRMASSEVNGADGEEFESLTVGPREVTMKLMVRGKTEREVQDAARTLMDMMLYRKPVPLRISDERDKEGNQLIRYAVPRGSFESEDYRHAGVWTVSFVQPDPYLYGKECSAHLYSNVEKEVVVGGNAPAKLVAKVKPQKDKTSCTLKAGGLGFVKYRAAFDGLTELTLDFASQYARLSKAITAEGLVAGSRFFEFDGHPMMEADAPTDLSWRERWI